MPVEKIWSVKRIAAGPYAKYLLGHERTGIARVGQSKRELVFLKRLALDQKKNGKPLLQDPVFAAKVASLEIELMALEVTVQRVVANETGGSWAPGPGSLNAQDQGHGSAASTD